MRNLLWIMLLSIFIGACTSNDSQFTVNGNIDDLPDGLVKLSNIVNDELNAVDSIESIDGAFQFTGTIESPELYLLTFADSRESIQLFVDKGEITVSGLLTESKVGGSATQVLFETFNTTLEEHTNQRRAFYQEYRAAQEVGDEETMATIEEQFNQVEEAEKDFIMDSTSSVSQSVST